MTYTRLIALAALGSAAVLGGAFLFQLAGYAPCQLCIWQRWPHAAAMLLGLLALWRPAPAWPLLGALTCLISAGLALFHSGVERKWWDGLESCTGGAGLGSDLLSLDGPMVVPCDQIPWELFGLSMANYNLLASLAFAALWLMAARRA